MTLEVLAIFDVKAAAFLPPFYAATVDVGVRTFGRVLLNPDSDFGKFPDDYTLYHLGSFEDATGEFATQPAVVVATGTSVISTLKVVR